MEKVVWKGSALTGPIPAALVTCGTAEKANVITIAWTGIVNSHPPMTYISVRPERYSYDIIDNSGEFVINIPTADMAKETDYCGVFTGRKVDKVKKCGFELLPGTEVSAPVISRCPLSLECRVTQKLELGSHTMFLAEILAVQVSADIIDSDGKLDLRRAGLLAYSHGDYFELGKRIGGFGFSGKKKKHK